MNMHTNDGPDNGRLVHDSVGSGASQNSQSAYDEDDIVSVNSKEARTGNKAGKTVFILVVGAIIVGLLTYLGQTYLNAWKQSAKGSNTRVAGSEVDPMNPEATRVPVTQVGAATGNPPPVFIDPAREAEVLQDKPSIRPIRNQNGEIVLDAQGRALGVDATGAVVTVPAIDSLPSEPQVQQGGQQSTVVQQTPEVKKSRYGGNLYAGVGVPASATPQQNGEQAMPAQSNPVDPNQQKMAQQIELIKTLMGKNSGGASPTKDQGEEEGEEDTDTPSKNGLQKVSTQGKARIPVIRASRFSDQNMMLPRGRQAQCVLTSRIDDQLPGFTSCILLEDLYSDNGKTLLLEKGSDLTGEYGNVGQAGVSRIAVNWIRIKTPDGVYVDLDSPGTDPLGGSGLPGHYNPRWPERVGAALLISLTKDVIAAALANQSKKSGTTVVVSPGQETTSTGATMSEQVIKETLKVRPNVTIAEGSRISIYVQSDLDFSPVYQLLHAKRAAAK